MDAERIKATVEQRVAAHSSFVYVKTKDRCEPRRFHRPSCRANHVSKPEHIARFFDSASDALASGLVPCKRCNPGDDRLANLPPKRKVWHVCRYLLEDPSGPWEEALNKHGFAKHHGHRTFKKFTGMTPLDFQWLVVNSRDEAQQLCLRLNEQQPEHDLETSSEDTVQSEGDNKTPESPSKDDREPEKLTSYCHMDTYTEPRPTLSPLQLPSPFASPTLAPMEPQPDFELYNRTDFDSLILRSLTPPLTPASDVAADSSSSSGHAVIDAISPYRIDRFNDSTTLFSTEWHSKKIGLNTIYQMRFSSTIKSKRCNCPSSANLCVSSVFFFLISSQSVAASGAAGTDFAEPRFGMCGDLTKLSKVRRTVHVTRLSSFYKCSAMKKIIDLCSRVWCGAQWW